MNHSQSSSIIRIARSNDFALVLSMLLMFTQSMHTGQALYDMTSLPTMWLKYAFAILTAFFMDFLIVYFIANGAIKQSYVFFFFCAFMNIYAYHIDGTFLNDFKSYATLIPAIGVPYAVHAVAMQIEMGKGTTDMSKKKFETI